MRKSAYVTLSVLIAMTIAALITGVAAAQDDFRISRRIDAQAPRVANKYVEADQLTADEVKSAVSQYFQWLYSARKDGEVAASSLRPVTQSPESQSFFDTKKESLEVADYSNQLYGVKIAEQSFMLDFRSISVARKGNLAEALVVESYQRKYEYTPVHIEGGEIVHKINLRNDRGAWEITDDSPLNANDVAPATADKAAVMDKIRREAEGRLAAEQQLLYNAGVTPTFLSQERKRLAKSKMSAQQAEEQLTNIVNEKMGTVPAAARDGSAKGAVAMAMNVNRSYNREAAKTYIDKWWNSRNPAWGNFDKLGGDCTNWMSQIINAGGVPEDKSGSYQWYWDNMNAPRTSSPYTRSPSWTGVNELWNYVVGNTANNGPLGPQGQTWSSSTGLTNMATGDAIQLNWDGAWRHTYGVHHTQWVNLKPWYCPWCSDNWKYKVYVTSHYANRWQDDLDSAAANIPTRRYIHITGWYQP